MNGDARPRPGILLLKMWWDIYCRALELYELVLGYIHQQWSGYRQDDEDKVFSLRDSPIG